MPAPVVEEMPEQGEIVIATVTKIMDHGAYVSLDEYDGLQGFLHISEIAPGWIRSITKFVKNGEKKVLLVKKINSRRGDIDLSLKQISKDQKKQKLREVKKFEKGNTLLQSVKEKASLLDEEIVALEDKIYAKFDSVYDAFIEVGRRGDVPITDMGITGRTATVMREVASKIKLPSVEIRGIMEVTSNRSDGVEVIKKILLDAVPDVNNNSSNNNNGAVTENIKIMYLGAPKYRLSIVSEDFKSAEKTLKPIISKIQSDIEKKKRGTFKFTREESRKTRDD